jgi:hypothetical protein
MNRIRSALRDFLSRHLRARSPRESFPLFNKLVFEPDKVTLADITPFKKQFGFDDIWIFHGIAMEREGKAILVSGPSGIGKSTLLRKFASLNMARPLDDGFILIGRNNGCYYIVESGLYDAMRTISILSKWLRILAKHESPYLCSDYPRDMDKGIRRGQLLHSIAFVIGALVSQNRSSVKVTSSPVRLVKLFLVKHEKDRHPPKRIGGDKIETIDAADAEEIFSKHLSCEVFHSTERGIKGLLFNRIEKNICSLRI